MKKIIVLGAGVVGSAIAIDLAKNYDVTSADFDSNKLSLIKTKNISTVKTDFTNKKELSELVKKHDLIVCAVPGFLGYNTLRTVIESEKNIVDISFFSEDPFTLDSLAKEKNVIAIVDCGVAPGLSSIILGYYAKKMEVEFYKCRECIIEPNERMVAHIDGEFAGSPPFHIKVCPGALEIRKY